MVNLKLREFKNFKEFYDSFYSGFALALGWSIPASLYVKYRESRIQHTADHIKIDSPVLDPGGHTGVANENEPAVKDGYHS